MNLLQGLPDKFPDPLVRYSAETQALFESTCHEYMANLDKFPQVMAYLKSRGLSPREISEAQLGFVPPYDERAYYLNKGRVVLPIRDSHGRYLAFAGRKFDEMADMTIRALKQMYKSDPTFCARAVEAWENGKWVNGRYPKKSHLYHLYEGRHEIIERGYIILVEGYFDALVLASRGMPNVGAVSSASITPAQIAILSRYCKRAVMLLDGDEAGDRGADRAMGLFDGTDVQLLVVRLPGGFDPDTYVQKYSPIQLRRIFEDSLEASLSDFVITI